LNRRRGIPNRLQNQDSTSKKRIIAEEAYREQARVDKIFENESKIWREAYLEMTPIGVIVQQRQAKTLEYVDGLRFPEKKRVLEIGCGAGFMTMALAKRGFDVEAIDHAPAMVELTQKLAVKTLTGCQIHVDRGDAHELTFQDRSFDLVIALGVMHWLHNPETAFKEISRVLVSKGYLILSESRSHALINPCSFSLIDKILERLKMPEQANRPRYYSNKKFSQDLKSAGFSLVKCTTTGYGPFATLRRLVKQESEIRIQQELEKYAKGCPILHSLGSQRVILARKN
jgi:ubiquinone/menaquinone biosynthesis C-methylase UbiE